MIHIVGSVAARRRAAGVIGVLALAATLLVSAGVAAQQQEPPIPTLNITPNTRVVNENAGTISFTATLSAAYAADSGTDVTFGYYLRGDEEAEHRATAGVDLDDASGSTGQVTIAAGQRSATIEVDIIDDALDEYDEGFALDLSYVNNAEFSDSITHYFDEERTLLRGHYVTGTIRDNDDPPELTLVVEESDDVTTESGRVLRYRITLSEPSGRPVMVKYEVKPGLARNSNGDLIDPDDCGPFSDRDVCQPATPWDEATSTGDFGKYLDDNQNQKWSEDNSTLEGAFVFVPGETGKLDDGSMFGLAEITVDVVNDTTPDVNDRDETLTVRLLPDSSFEFSTNEDKTAEGLILDDDLPRVSINQWGAGPEGPYETAWGIGASPAPTETLTVKYRTVDNVVIPGEYSSNDEGETRCTATAGQDYEAISGTLTFNAGERQKRVNTMKLDDLIAEPVERICLELSYPDPDPTVQDPPPPNFLLDLDPIWYDVIYDDEPPQLVTVDSPEVNENAGSLTFTVTLARPGSDTSEPFSYETIDGTATAGQDYTSKTGTLLFSPGTQPTIRKVSIPITNDSLDEPDRESFTLRVTGESDTLLASGTGTIIDDDGAPSLSVGDARADEDDGTLEFTVRLSPASAKEVKVAYATSDGPGTAPATAPDDYSATVNELAFGPGETEKTVPVTIIDDTLYEGNETFTLTLSGPFNAQFSSQANTVTATGTIVENESAPSLSVADVTGAESADVLTFEVTLGSQIGSTVTVDYTTEQLTGTNRARRAQTAQRLARTFANRPARWTSRLGWRGSRGKSSWRSARTTSTSTTRRSSSSSPMRWAPPSATAPPRAPSPTATTRRACHSTMQPSRPRRMRGISTLLCG